MTGATAARWFERRGLAGRYTALRRLAEPRPHHLSLVFRAYDEHHGRDVAIKMVHPRLAHTPHTEIIAHEARQLRSLRGIRGVVRLHEGLCVVADADAPPWFALPLPYIVTELGRADLSHYIASARRNPRDSARLFHQLCVTVRDLHRAGVHHRDLKPTNCVVLPSGDLRLIDFGSSVSHCGGQPEVIRASVARVAHPPFCDPRYTAIELEFGFGTRSTSWAPAEAFALGAILFELWTGRGLIEMVYDRAMIADITALLMRIRDLDDRARLYERIAAALAEKWRLPLVRELVDGPWRRGANTIDDIYLDLSRLDWRKRCADLDRIIARLDSVIDEVSSYSAFS